MEKSPLDQASKEIEEIITANLAEGPISDSLSNSVVSVPSIEGDQETLTPRQIEQRNKSALVRAALMRGENNPLLTNIQREAELEQVADLMEDGEGLTGNHTGGHAAAVSIREHGEW